MKHEKPYDKSVFRSLTLITQFGINMLVPIAMMTALGIFLDQKFETGWITIVLFFVGAIAGGQNVWRMAKKGLNESERSKRTPGESQKEE
ncbi:MAG: AtpZ/AtpI family protein [Lachnospiraceae bacterium]|nr:AtpZ/AtpI family protein [Lachnospiraceae bacterium]